MFFRCVNCGGNVIYSPEEKRMGCPYCGGRDCEKPVEVPNVTNCPNCGGEVKISEVTSASRCEYCGSYLIYDTRVNGDFKPHLIMPFKLGREVVKNMMKKEFKKKTFAPDDFLSEVKLKTMEGEYVPFWMYNCQCHYEFFAKATKTKTWRTGNTEHTETSYFNVYRNMDANFERIPVDASVKMEDGAMDLLEPYDYKQLEAFQEKYMSGFLAERYNMSAEELSPRADTKVKNDTEGLMKNTLNGYNTINPVNKEMKVDMQNCEYALLPVWTYQYAYKGKPYPFRINGQTGKIVGEVPISKRKVYLYSLTVFGIIVASGCLLNGILGAIL